MLVALAPWLSGASPFQEKLRVHIDAYDAELDAASACTVATSTHAAAGVRAWRALAVEHERARLEAHFRFHKRFMPEDNTTAVRYWGSRKASSTTAWPQLFNASFACPAIERIPPRRHGGTTTDADYQTWKFLCAPHRLRKSCKLLSLGCNFQDAFEEALQCRSVIVDPTLDEAKVSPSTARDFATRVARRGDVLNRSVGIGVGTLEAGGKAVPLVSLRTLLASLQQGPSPFFSRAQARHMGASCAKQPVDPRGAHIDVLKVDIEGSEYELLPEVFELCRTGMLTVDQLLVEVHSGLVAGRARHSAASLHAVFHGAHHCQLMLFHKELNLARAGRNSEFSWVSMRHVLRLHTGAL